MTSTLQRYQRIAPLYDLLDRPFEYRRYRRIRPLLFEGLSGRILDAGVGTGRNAAFYPRGTSVVGIDLSPAMLARAERRRTQSAVAVELRRMDVTKLDFPSTSFDAAVATFLFCVLADDQQVPALRELRRVVRPGGMIGLLGYVRPAVRCAALALQCGSLGSPGLTALASTATPRRMFPKPVWNFWMPGSLWMTSCSCSPSGSPTEFCPNHALRARNSEPEMSLHVSATPDISRQ